MKDLEKEEREWIFYDAEMARLDFTRNVIEVIKPYGLEFTKKRISLYHWNIDVDVEDNAVGFAEEVMETCNLFNEIKRIYPILDFATTLKFLRECPNVSLSGATKQGTFSTVIESCIIEKSIERELYTLLLIHELPLGAPKEGSISNESLDEIISKYDRIKREDFIYTLLKPNKDGAMKGHIASTLIDESEEWFENYKCLKSKKMDFYSFIYDIMELCSVVARNPDITEKRDKYDKIRGWLREWDKTFLKHRKDCGYI